MTLSTAARSDVIAALRLAGTPPSAARGDGSAGRRHALEQLLYAGWFSQAGRFRVDGEVVESGWPTLVARLRAAHAATSRLEPGWQAVGAGLDGAVTAVRGGEHINVAAGDFVAVAHPGTPVRAGTALAVSRRRDGVNSDGWWVTSASIGPAPERNLVRVYWDCPVAAAPSLVSALTEQLEESSEPYTLKCPAVGHLFDRVDSCVLYLGLESWHSMRRALRDVHDRLAHQLRPTVPPLTLTIGRGVALAEDPANGQSFGQSRVHAVADGLLTAASRGIVDEPGVLDVVAERFVANGIDPARPHQAVDSPPDRLVPW